MEKLFVYGTMKKGFRNAARLDNCEFLGNTQTINSNFYMKVKKTGADYYAPVVYKLKKDYVGFKISGELYNVHKSILNIIDRFEGHPIIYKRKQILVENYDSLVWVYLSEQDIMENYPEGISYNNFVQTFITKELI